MAEPQRRWKVETDSENIASPESVNTSNDSDKPEFERKPGNKTGNGSDDKTNEQAVPPKKDEENVA